MLRFISWQKNRYLHQDYQKYNIIHRILLDILQSKDFGNMSNKVDNLKSATYRV